MRFVVAIPGEFHPHAAMLVAEISSPGGASDDGDLRAVDPRFKLWRRAPGLGSGDNFKSGAQRGSLTLAADQCLRLVAVHVGWQPPARWLFRSSRGWPLRAKHTPG